MERFCSKCGSKMIESIKSCETLISMFTDEGGSKRYRADTGEEIKIRQWKCPNYGLRTNYSLFEKVILGYPKYDLSHEVKSEYINNDNPNAIIL